MQRSAFSAMGCINAGIGIFYLRAEMQPSAADAREKCINVNEPLDRSSCHESYKLLLPLSNGFN